MKVPILEYQKFLEDLAKTKGVELSEIKNKMANCGAPGANVVKVREFFKEIYNKMINYDFRLMPKQKQQLQD